MGRDGDRTEEATAEDAHGERLAATRPRAKRQPVSCGSASRVLRALPVPVCAVDAAGKVVLFNDACERLTGLASGQILGKSMVDSLVPLAWRPMVAARLAEPDRLALGDSWEAPWQGADGRLHLLEWVATRLPDDEASPAALLCIGRQLGGKASDTASRIARDTAFAQLMQLRTLGDMTTALAHELSQPLSATLTYLQGSIRLLRSSGSMPTNLVEHLEEAAAQAHRAGTIVQHIRRITRRHKPARRQVDLDRLLQGVVKWVAVEARSDAVMISLNLAADLPHVTVEPIAIEQVILNLLHNSIEAMTGAPPDGTAIPPATGATVAPSRIAVTTRFSQAGAVEVVVEDNGPGIPAQLAQQLFEPFVSAKPDGIGLGLTICRAIIRDHGGDLWLDHAAGPGARFVFTLPVQPPAPALCIDPVTDPKGGGTLDDA